MTLVLEEILRVESDNTGLIRLSNISEDDINHTDKHSIFLRVTSILNNGDDVCSLLSKVNQITARSMRELNSIDNTLGSDNIRAMRYGSSRCSTKVQ